MDPMLEVYILENSQLIEQLEEMFLNAEKNKMLTSNQVNEVFRIMHTIKGSSAMMSYENIATLAHRLEDLFSSVRDTAPPEDIWPPIFDLVLEAVDIFKEEMEKISAGGQPDADTSEMIAKVEALHAQMKGEAPAAPPAPATQEAAAAPENPEQGEAPTGEGGICYKAHIEFQEDAGMETIRAFGIVNEIKPLAECIVTIPIDINSNHDEEITEAGFTIYFTSIEEEDYLRSKLEETILLKTLHFDLCPDCEIPSPMKCTDKSQKQAQGGATPPPAEQSPGGGAAQPAEDAKDDKPASAAKPAANGAPSGGNVAQSYISVNVDKIDSLMSLMGEIVTTESMVVKNPDLEGLKLENFDKQARLLKKLTTELQDIVMSIRMVPISSTFHKMKRIVRDMSKKVNKEVELVLIGEKTEVDKNVIDHLSDPLMHLIRNSMDHGLETPQEREEAGKDRIGHVTLEARNTGGDIVVSVKDDGRGLNREKLIQKAQEKGITSKSSGEISDKEAYNYILMPGFSTKAQVTEFSGRGVGMDVVRSNIEAIGGSMSIDSTPGAGTTITMHIPLTLAIIDGMNVTIGDGTYVIPILNIQESLEGKSQEVITDPNGNEMAIIRGEALPVIRVYERFGLETDITDIKDGVLVLVKSEKGAACLFVDELIGEQQAVIKPVPQYISHLVGKLDGVAGCTILGDGSISLITDVNGLLGS